MKLQLEQNEIEQAVREYVANQGIKVEGKTLDLKFTMTRGDAGLIADLSIGEATPTKTPTKQSRAGTVGAAIADQGAGGASNAKAATGSNTVNKLPTTAAEAIAEANAKAAEAPEDVQESAAEEGAEAVVVVEEAKTTTSLFS